MDVRVGGAWESPDRAEAYKDGAWRTLQYGEAYYSGAWRQIATFVPALSVAISPTTASATGSTVTTNSVTATPTGGLGPFTYAWTLVSNSGVTSPAITSPSTAATRFTGSPTDGHSGTATFRCTVTDSLGTVATADVEATWFIPFDTGGNL